MNKDIHVETYVRLYACIVPYVYTACVAKKRNYLNKKSVPNPPELPFDCTCSVRIEFLQEK